MRLEQMVTVRLSAADVTQLKSRHTLTVACACGQHINLAWDTGRTTEPGMLSPRVLVQKRRAAAHARSALAKKRATAKLHAARRAGAEARQHQRAERAKTLRAASTARRRQLTARLLAPRAGEAFPTCPVCKRTFPTQAGVHTHHQRVHLGVGPQKGRTTKVGQPDTPCPKCGKLFYSDAGVRMHHQRTHEGIGPQRSGHAEARP
jgi:uncharacterized C2H2 Zn-finger protein